LGYISEISAPVCKIDARILVCFMMQFSPQEHHETYFTRTKLSLLFVNSLTDSNFLLLFEEPLFFAHLK